MARLACLSHHLLGLIQVNTQKGSVTSITMLAAHILQLEHLTVIIESIHLLLIILISIILSIEFLLQSLHPKPVDRDKYQYLL